MPGSEFAVAFDLAADPNHWVSDLAPMMIVPGIILLTLIAPKKLSTYALFRDPRGLAGRLFFGSIVGLFGIVYSFVFYDHWIGTRTLLEKQSRGELSFVSGCLQRFHPMPEQGHENEKIEINGEVFAYSDFDASTSSFNNTESHGGPIHADSAVRIWHSGNDIVRLEVSDHACPAAPDFG